MTNLPPPEPSETPTALPGGVPDDVTPALPSEPSPISDAALPAVVEQLRPIFAEVVRAAVEEAIAAVPTPTLRPGTVTTVNMATKTATVSLDEGTDGSEAVNAQIVSEMPVPNDRVMVMFVPPNAAFVVGIIGGSGLPAGTVVPYFGRITSDAGGTNDTAPPRGFLWAHGQDYDGARYPALWAAIGTTFGTGSATGSGRVPDMRGRMPIGLDNMGGSDAGRISLANVVGTVGGAESHSLSTSNMPSHAHTMNNHTHSFSGSVSGSVSASGSASSAGNHTHVLGNNIAFAAPSTVGLLPGGSNPFTGSSGLVSNAAGAHTHPVSVSGSISGGSVSGTTGGSNASTSSVGSGSPVNHLPPVIVCHWLIKA